MTANTQHDLWSAKLPNGEVRSGTLEQLGEAFRAGHVSETTLVCASGSDQWTKLVDVLRTLASPAPVSVRPAGGTVPPRASVAPRTSAPPPSTRPEPAGDLWQVRLPTGQIRSGTRQQLEEAFRDGHLDAECLVLATGATSWRTLGAILAKAESDGAWQVRLADGQQRAGTREQLEEAFRSGHLDPNALVLAAGTTNWVPLHTVMTPGPAAAPEPAATPPAEAAPALEEPGPGGEPHGAIPGAGESVEAPVAASPAPVWHVRLTEQQLEAAFQAGVFGEDAQVMMPGAEQWVEYGSVLRSRAG